MSVLKTLLKHTPFYEPIKTIKINHKMGPIPEVAFDSRTISTSKILLDTKKTYKKVAIVASFVKDGFIQDYFVHYLKVLNTLFDGVILIGDCPILESEISKIEKYLIYYNFERHYEYDFGSYKKGFNFLKDNNLFDGVEEILFTNDSCFGPVTNLKSVISEMQSRNLDFWGLVQNQEIRDHIQSWFIYLNNRVVHSKALEDFLMNVKREKYQWDVVRKYEIRFTNYLYKKGFVFGSFINVINCPDINPYNPMLYPYDLLSKYDFPFIKIKTFTEYIYRSDERNDLMVFLKENYIEMYEMILMYLQYKNYDTGFLKVYDVNDLTIEDFKAIIEQKEDEIKYYKALYNGVISTRKWKLANCLSKVYKALPFRFQNHGMSTLEQNAFPYKSEYQNNQDFSKYKTTIKALAFYLPQYHEFEENNRWWGKGFTEWVNAKKAKPRFKDHYQPRLPHDDIGYYDLSDVNTLKKQAALAKQHGIYGFIFYYYWFSGKKLMDLPLQLLLSHPEIDLPFCLCWANENWTRRWDGQNSNILIAQNYSDDDPEKFIHDLKMYVEDKRYIKVEGKPFVLIYNPYEIPHIEEVIEKWRAAARKEGIGELYIATRNVMFSNKFVLKNCDAEFDFPPVYHAQQEFLIKATKGYSLFDYYSTVERVKKEIKRIKHIKPYYFTSTMGWDNTSRRKNNCFVFYHYDLAKFYDWNKAIVENLKQKPVDQRIMMVNAWNEWCEGTYLEPDQKYGYSAINTLSKAIFDLPYLEVKHFTNPCEYVPTKPTRIAIQIHLFHIDLIDTLIDVTNNVPYCFDIYISTDSKEKKNIIEEKFASSSKANKVVVEVFANRGRDVRPFLLQMKKYIQDYDYICHIHSKKTKFAKYGDSWRDYLYFNLFGNKDNVSHIIKEFDTNEKLGVIYPETFKTIANQTSEYNGNYDICAKIAKKIGIPKQYLNQKLVFPSGTMFWAKTDAIAPLFSKKIKPNDFEKEANQTNVTFAHGIERIICNLAYSRGYTSLQTINECEKKTQ